MFETYQRANQNFLKDGEESCFDIMPRHTLLL
jgi:hypothetical protein